MITLRGHQVIVWEILSMSGPVIHGMVGFNNVIFAHKLLEDVLIKLIGLMLFIYEWISKGGLWRIILNDLAAKYLMERPVSVLLIIAIVHYINLLQKLY